MLLKLADIASSHGFGELAQEFRFLYLDELLGTLGFSLIISNLAEKERCGYLILKLKGQEQIDDAIDLLHKRSGYKGGDKSRDSIEQALLGYKRKAK